MLQIPESGEAVRRECLRSLLRRGIYSFNSGKTEHAIRLFEYVLSVSPTDLKANYALQLAYLKTGRHHELEDLTSRMRWIYACFQVPTVRRVIATGYENLSLAAYRAGAAQDAFLNWQRSRNP